MGEPELIGAKLAETERQVSTPQTPAMRRDYDQRMAEERRADEQLRRARAWDLTECPERHAQATGLRGAPWHDKLERLKGLLGSSFLVALLGDRGTGKTQMAVELVRSHVHHSKRFTALYVRALEVFMAIKEAYGGHAGTERQRLRRFIEPGLLVIDDAHERGETDWENRMLSYLIDCRYAALAADTLLISNQQPEAFKASVGPSVFTRLQETGAIVVCDWPSFRQKT